MDTDTRERILKAAGRLFAEQGYARTTTRAIAAAAGVNEVTLFRHFSSKQNLLRAFVEQFNAQGFPGTFEQNLTGSYPDDVRFMARAAMQSTIENFQLLRIMLCDALDVPEIRQAALEGARQNAALFADYFRRQIEAGVVRDELLPEALAQTFDALFSSSLIVPLVFQTGLSPDMPAETLRDQMADIFIQGTLKRSSEGN
ncbi:MAG: TetR/AcrR family transcriptional regulator [Chloroflexi bacterium]|nr:TetR/AcrR family transcriptional regulator [Chloroflexota bacterium]MDL1883570.1 TetR/AcrR family transcriptional regulator [Anaerolineae bacterium CFX8]